MSIGRPLSQGLILLILTQALTACGGVVPADGVASRASAVKSVAQRGALLYVADVSTDTVAVFSYPKLVFKGVLSGFFDADSLCVDKRTGAVWVPESRSHKVVEYAHGGTNPIRVLEDGSLYPFDCAVNPNNGDLAVVAGTGNSQPDAVAVFANGSGVPKTYASAGIPHMASLDYDGTGDIFVDGFGSYNGFRLAELKTDEQKLVVIPWRGPRIKFVGSVQVDRDSVVVSNTGAKLYQTSDGVVTGTTILNRACFMGKFFLDQGLILVPNHCQEVKGSVKIYDFPQGGTPVRRLAGFEGPVAVVISR